MDINELIEPTRATKDLVTWVANYAKRHGIAVLMVAWDRRPSSPPILLTARTHDDPKDEQGGFAGRLGFALLGDGHIAEVIAETAQLLATGGANVFIKDFDLPKEE